MVFKGFTRTDDATVRATLVFYREVIQKHKHHFITPAILLPIAALMYVVITPLLLSLILQSLITNPHDLTTIW